MLVSRKGRWRGQWWSKVQFEEIRDIGVASMTDK